MRSSDARSLLSARDAIRLHLVDQSAAADLEELGRSGLIAVGGCERIDDALPFEIAHARPQVGARPASESSRIQSQIGRFDVSGAGEQDGAIDHVLELSDVSWKVMSVQRFARAVRERGRRDADTRCRLFGKTACQVRELAATLAQRRNFDGNSRQPKEQILPKRSVGHAFCEVAIGGRNEAHVDASRLNASHATQLAAFQQAQQLCLDGRGHLAHFVEEERSAVRRFDQSLFAGSRSSERTTFVPKELALQQRVRRCCAIQRHERALVAWRRIVERAGRNLLANTRLAEEQHTDVAPRNQAEELRYPCHRSFVGPWHWLAASRCGSVAADFLRSWLDHQGHGTDTHQLTGLEAHSRASSQSLAADERPVRAAEIFDLEPIADVDSHVLPRYGLVIDEQLAIVSAACGDDRPSREVARHHMTIPECDQRERPLVSCTRPDVGMRARSAVFVTLGHLVSGALRRIAPQRPRSTVWYHGRVPEQRAPTEPRTVVGRYTLYDAIASGGMATVYMGRLLGPAGFSRTVAIKRLHPQFAKDPDFVGMFLDEARLAAKVRHPNVVSILDVVSVEREVFLIMDYVDGESLSRLLKKSRERRETVPPSVASSITSQMLYGLHAAHEATGDSGEPLSIVHRDVSPQNVLVGLDGVARVVDFGVAKAERRLQDTEAGRLKGKIAYMSPEQVSAGEVDRRADVFAAGIVAWELWTGRRLFTAEQLVSVVEQVKIGEIPTPSSQNALIPPELDRVVMRALEREPDRRYATAKEMAMAFEEVVPPAVTRIVGEWVERIAGETLEKRSLMLHELESHERSMHSSGRSFIAKIIDPKADQSTTSLLYDVERAPAAVAPAHELEEEAATRTWEPSEPAKRESELSAAASWDTSRSPARSRFTSRPLVLGAAVGALLFALAVTSILLVSPRSDPPRALERGLGHGWRALPAAPPPTHADSTPAPLSSSIAAGPTSPKPQVTHVRPAVKVPAQNCNPPYVKGPDGIVRFKRECLK